MYSEEMELAFMRGERDMALCERDNLQELVKWKSVDDLMPPPEIPVLAFRAGLDELATTRVVIAHTKARGRWVPHCGASLHGRGAVTHWCHIPTVDVQGKHD